MNISTRIIASMMIIVIVLISIIATVYVITQEGDEKQQQINSQQEDKMIVFTTFYAMHEFTKNIAGEKAIVENLIPFNVEPHTYEITPKKLVSLSKGDMIVYNGAEFEPFVTDIRESGSFEHLVFVDAVNGIELFSADHDDKEDNDYTYDPHVWLDPILAKQQVQTIANALSTNDPDNAAYYQNNAKSYSSDLDRLDSKIRQELASCKKDTFIPFHNAFTYFAERYGLHIKPLTGLAPIQDVTAKQIVEFIKFAQENDIRYFFTEEMVDPKLSEQLAREVNGGILVFSPLEGINSDDQKRNATYFDKMDDNLENLKIALECNT